MRERLFYQLLALVLSVCAASIGVAILTDTLGRYRYSLTVRAKDEPCTQTHAPVKAGTLSSNPFAQGRP